MGTKLNDFLNEQLQDEEFAAEYYKCLKKLNKETYHLLEDKANYNWLIESKEQIEKGKFKTHELIE